MKILYHHRIASKDGQYVHVKEIIHALRKAGHTVAVVAPNITQTQSFGSDGGWVAKLKTLLPRSIYEILEFIYSLFIFIKLSLAILRVKPDFIYERYNLFTPAGVWAKKVFNIPLILEINAPLYEERSRYHSIVLTKLAKWSQRYTWNNADKVLPVTQVLADIVQAYGVSEQKIEVIHNGTDLFTFSSKKTVVANNKKLTIGFVGFVREWHRLDYIIELLAQTGNEQLKLLIVGDGPALSALKEQAQQLGVVQRVEITGLVERHAIPVQLARIDIAIQPAVVEYASPLKLIEYLAMGLAIVAPDQPNIRELLTDKDNALLFEPNNPQACANAITRLINDPILMNNIAQQAQKTIKVKRLTWDENAKQIIQLAK